MQMLEEMGKHRQELQWEQNQSSILAEKTETASIMKAAVMEEQKSWKMAQYGTVQGKVLPSGNNINHELGSSRKE